VAKGRTLPILGFAFAAAELGILLGPQPIRIAAGLTLGFILPGLLVTRVILARTRIEGAEQLLLVPGMSIAVAVITGLVLNAADIRLTVGNWAIALGLVCAAGLVVLVMLEDDDERKRRRRPLRIRLAAAPGGRLLLAIGPAALFVMAALLVSGALVVGVLGGRDRNSEAQFTELWALPGPSPTADVRLGVRSHERGDMRYRVRVSLEGRVVRSQALTLKPGQTWQSTQPVPRPGEHVGVALLKSPGGRVYRLVHLTAG
jgi:uncharacterized membrane protein